MTERESRLVAALEMISLNCASAAWARTVANDALRAHGEAPVKGCQRPGCDTGHEGRCEESNHPASPKSSSELPPPGEGKPEVKRGE